MLVQLILLLLKKGLFFFKKKVGWILTIQMKWNITIIIWLLLSIWTKGINYNDPIDCCLDLANLSWVNEVGTNYLRVEFTLHATTTKVSILSKFCWTK